MLNPSGIIFGQNARFNIGGSFVGTTANSIKFADWKEFSAVNPSSPPLLRMSVPISAVNPSSPPLLRMSVPIGLKMGQNAAQIQVQGKLTTGQDLTLEAGSLELQGQLVAGRDLTLKAQDTV